LPTWIAIQPPHGSRYGRFSMTFFRFRMAHAMVAPLNVTARSISPGVAAPSTRFGFLLPASSSSSSSS